MTIEDELLKSLLAFEAAVSSISKDKKPDLMSHFNQIDNLASQLPKTTDGELLHYLQKKSYEKPAYFWKAAMLIFKKVVVFVKKQNV